ncbi:hypothetical protein ACJX0J_016704, partial [Zea mays]
HLEQTSSIKSLDHRACVLVPMGLIELDDATTIDLVLNGVDKNGFFYKSSSKYERTNGSIEKQPNLIAAGATGKKTNCLLASSGIRYLLGILVDEDMKKNTMMMVEQSKVLNTPGAEKKTKRELFDALRQEL